MEKFFTLNQFAKLIGTSVAAVIGHIERGNLKTVNRRVRAIPASELDKFLAAPKDKIGRRKFQRLGKQEVINTPTVDLAK